MAGLVGVKHYKTNIEIGGSITFSGVHLGLAVISSSSAGNSAVFLVSTYNVTLVSQTSESFSSHFSVTKQNNGELTITNLHSTTRYIEIVLIANTGR